MATQHGTRFIDLTGKTFGRLTAIRCAGRNKHKQILWLCRCVCGNERVVVAGSLANGDTQSCGCWHKEITRRRSLTHGHKSDRKPTATYKSWEAMKRRCQNPKSTDYARYGGRGIRVCDRWQHFEHFLADMGEKPRGLTIERKDNHGHYEPGNCKWATSKEQGANRRSNHVLTLAGLTLTMTEWGRKLGLRPSRIYRRLMAGWSSKDALRPFTTRLPLAGDTP